MARKKKADLMLVGLGKDPDNSLVVQKSKPLTSLWASDLTLAEFKILDLYLARIDSHKPEYRKVVLDKRDIEEALGVEQIRPEVLAERLIRLGQGIKIPDEKAYKGFRIMWLLEEAVYAQDESGHWTVTLEASSKAMDLFFNIEDLGYFRYKLRNVAGLKSRYSYILFMYIEENRYRKTWEVKLDDLRSILQCTEESYSKFGVFNDRVLKPSYQELMEKTETRFSYGSIKDKRIVIAIRFTVESIKETSYSVKKKNEKNIDNMTEDLKKKCEYIPSRIPNEKNQTYQEEVDAEKDDFCDMDEDDDFEESRRDEKPDYYEMERKHQEALKKFDEKMKKEEADRLSREPIRDPNDPLKIISDACAVMDENEQMVPEFTRDEMKRIRFILEEVPRYKLPCGVNGTSGIESQRYRYLVEKYRQLEHDNSLRSINSRFAYFYELIEHDAYHDNYIN